VHVRGAMLVLMFVFLSLTGFGALFGVVVVLAGWASAGVNRARGARKGPEAVHGCTRGYVIG
jgi:hypothetical protein